MRDKVWFFGALRRALSSSGISRTSAEVARIEAYPGSVGLFDNDSESWQPFFKVTSKFGSHDVQGFYQRDRLLLTGDREYNYEPIQAQSTGGPLYSGKVTSVWGSSVTTTFSGVLQRQGRLGRLDVRDARADRPADHHPQQRDAVGRHAAGHRPHPRRRQPAVVQLPAGVADHRARRPHLLQGRLVREPRVPDRLLLRAAQHLQPGHPLRERRLRARGAPPASTSTTSPPARFRSAAATRPRSTCGRGRPRIATSPSTSRTRGGRTPALTLNLGVRADFVKRNDKLFDIIRQDSTEIGPRFGFSYHADQRRPHDAARQRRARARAGDGPRRHHAVRRQRGRRRRQHLRPERQRRVRGVGNRHHAGPRRRRSPTTSSPTTCTSPTSTSSSSACAASSRGS